MTFKDIVIKNFIRNARRYFAYFLCCSFSIMMFFLYSTLLFNDSLSISKEIEKGLLSALIIPSVVLILFSIVFISYAHSTFMNARRKEFGLFMTLGMTPTEIRRLVLFENGFLAIGSMFVGVVTGSIFSYLFFLFIMKAIEVSQVTFQLGIKNYLFSIATFGIIYTFLIILTSVTTTRLEIVKLLKSDRTHKKDKIQSPILGVIGMIGMVAAASILKLKFGLNGEKDGELLFQCTLFIMIGLYISISQIGNLIISLHKKGSFGYYKNILALTSLNHKFKQTKKIFFALSITVMVSIFYNSHCLTLYLGAERNAIEANPYDVTFVKTQGKNNLSERKLNEIIEKSSLIVKKNISVEFADIFLKSEYEDQQRYTIFSDENISLILKKQIKVGIGQCIKLVQYTDLTAREKENQNKMGSSFTIGQRRLEYIEADNVYDILPSGWDYFGGVNIYIINRVDYQQLKASNTKLTIGNLRLINFDKWKESREVVRQLEDALLEYNKNIKPMDTMLYFRSMESEEKLMKVLSRIESYNINRQQSGLVFFLSTFVSIFFFLASCMIVFLKLISEIDMEKQKYKKLYKIGITEKEIKRNIAKELGIIFFLAPMIGIIIAFVYINIFYGNSSRLGQAMLYSTLLSGVYVFSQLIYYMISKRVFFNEIMKEIR